MDKVDEVVSGERVGHEEVREMKRRVGERVGDEEVMGEEEAMGRESGRWRGDREREWVK